VKGPNAANLTMAWRFANGDFRGSEVLTLLSGILYNGTAGLLDINLNQGQKVLNSYAEYERMKDYEAFILGGTPKTGQTLEDVQKLLSDQIDSMKKTACPEWWFRAVITDLKLQRTQGLESNRARAYKMMNAFVNDYEWQRVVERLNRATSISKQE